MFMSHAFLFYIKYYYSMRVKPLSPKLDHIFERSCLIKNYWDFWFELRHMCLEVNTLILKIRKKLEKLKINNFSWTQQGTEIERKIVFFKSGETGAWRVLAKICLSWAEATETINW